MSIAQKIDVREAPTAAFIAEVRHRFQVEPTIDRELTAKLHRRSQPLTPLAGLPDIRARLVRFLAAKLGREFKLHHLGYLAGGASKEQFVFELEYPGAAQPREKLVLRRDPCEGITPTDREREFQLLRAFEGIVPVPSARWLDQQGEFFGRPALICRFVSGVQKPQHLSGNVTGLGILFPPATRQHMADKFVGALARIHTADLHSADLSAFHRPPAGTAQAEEMHLDWWARVWFEDRLEEVPLMTITERWLRRQVPTLDVVSLVHGDYRSGNFLFDEATCKITAILDWELAHFGDRHCDLAWIIFQAFLMRDEHGQLLCSGMLSRAEMLALYRAKSGLTVDEDKLRYFEIFMLWKGVIIVLASAPRVALGQRTHHDILVNWLAGISFVLLDALRLKLREVM